MLKRSIAISGWAWVATALALASTSALALPSSAVFSYSGQPGAPADVRLEVVTNTGTYQINGSLRGWVAADGSNLGADPANNYIAGLCGSSDSCRGDDVEVRNWYAFSLVTTAFTSITSASLLLDVPNPGSGDQGVYVSPLGNPTYTLWDVTQPTGNFTGGTAGLAEYNDLGSGTSFGARVYSLADQGNTTTIALNAAAVAFLNDNLQGTVILGGAVTPIPTQQVAATIPVPATSPATLVLVAALLALLAFAALRRRG